MNDLEQKIKDSFDEITIHTTSNDILNQFQMTKKKKSRFSWNKKWTFVVCSFACLLVLIPVLIFHFSFNNIKPFEIVYTSKNLTDDTILNTLSVELLCGKSFEKNAVQSRRSLSSFVSLDTKNEEESADFELIVDRFHPVSDMVINLLDQQDGMIVYFKNDLFEYQGTSYQYAFISGEDIIYLNTNLTECDEVETEVLIWLNNQYYQGNLDYQMNQKELMMELSYQRDNTLITIEKETKNDKFSLSYSEKTSSSEIEYEIELEYKEGKLICEYEYETDNQEFEIEISIGENRTYFIKGEDIENIILTIDEPHKIYKCGEKIIKK